MDELLKRSLSEFMGGAVVQVSGAVKKKRRVDSDDSKKMEQTMHLLYTASRIKIYKIADKMASCKIHSGVPLRKESEIAIPRADEWDFELGDRVRIKLPFSEFKSVQERTLGWNKRLHIVYGKVGIITKLICKSQNFLQVYMPEIYSTSLLYPGVLEKDHSEDRSPIPSQWKIGDFVATKTDPAVTRLLQRRRDTIPQKLLGRKGRVIAVTRVAVVVTFDEKTSYDINSYLLTRCRDQSPIPVETVEHPKGFKMGQKVKMISNFKELIKNQKGKGEWNSDMSSMAGGEVTVVNIQEDGTLNVQPTCGRPWRVSSDSVMKLGETEPKGEDDLDYLPGDIVKIRIPMDARLLLNAANIPAGFLEYLKNTAKLMLVDDDFDYLIGFNQDQKVSAFASTLRKATQEEISRHKEVEAMENNLQVGQKVCLDVGPPNYVTSVLRQIDAEQETVMALTNVAKLVGFAEDNRAVIEYQNGNWYKIKKKFLTVPDKFDIKDVQEGMSSDTVKEIQDMVAKCVRMIHENSRDFGNQKYSVGILSVLYGNPPVVDFRIHSTMASSHDICKYLKDIAGWVVDEMGEGTIYVKKLNTFSEVVKIGLYFNNEYYFDRAPQVNWSDRTMEEVVKVREEAPAKCGTEPIPEELQQPLPLQQSVPDQPVTSRPAEFRYMMRYEPSLGENVFVPFFTAPGLQRNPAAPIAERSQQHRTIVYNIDKVDNISNN